MEKMNESTKLVERMIMTTALTDFVRYYNGGGEKDFYYGWKCYNTVENLLKNFADELNTINSFYFGLFKKMADMVHDDIDEIMEVDLEESMINDDEE